ncbi:MAG: hypothetical protein H8K04_08035 [Nitrospira sp.]
MSEMNSNNRVNPVDWSIYDRNLDSLRRFRSLESFDRRLHSSWKIICVCLAFLAGNTGYAGYGLAVETVEASRDTDDPRVDHVVSGTLDQLDYETRKGLIKTDLGKPVFFEMVRPELFKRFSVGQRVTIGINEQGQAVKVIETPPVELPNPPSSSGGQ